jgi:hypothetical protein
LALKIETSLKKNSNSKQLDHTRTSNGFPPTNRLLDHPSPNDDSWPPHPAKKPVQESEIICKGPDYLSTQVPIIRHGNGE